MHTSIAVVLDTRGAYSKIALVAGATSARHQKLCKVLNRQVVIPIFFLSICFVCYGYSAFATANYNCSIMYSPVAVLGQRRVSELAVFNALE